MAIRRWSDTVVAYYRNDGNPFGGRLLRVKDSTWDSGEDAAEKRTGVREWKAPRGALEIEVTSALDPGLDPDE